MEMLSSVAMQETLKALGSSSTASRFYANVQKTEVENDEVYAEEVKLTCQSVVTRRECPRTLTQSVTISWFGAIRNVIRKSVAGLFEDSSITSCSSKSIKLSLNYFQPII